MSTNSKFFNLTLAFLNLMLYYKSDSMKNKRFNKLEKICLIIALLSAILCFVGYFSYSYLIEPEITLKGKKEITIDLNSKYNDPGVTAFQGEKDISKNVKIKGKVDTTKVGDYTLTYIITNLKGYQKQEITRVIKVRDGEKPTLKLKGKSPYVISYQTTYKEPGYTATDNYDGNLTNKVKITGKVNTKKLGTYKLYYTVEDSSSNKITKIRVVKVVDNKSPQITLKGKSRIVIKLNGHYQEPGYTAYDNYEGDMTNKVYISGKVNTKKAGVYKITYNLSDSSGNFTSVERFIQVGNQSDIDEDNYIFISIKEQKLWYYKNGKLFLSTDIVSGRKGVWDTLTGEFRITDKVAGTYLVGVDYRCWVDYWMLFDYASQSGLHDATWLSEFGGDIYETKGSHGCVNMPYNKAQKLFRNVSLGTLVLIY